MGVGRLREIEGETERDAVRGIYFRGVLWNKAERQKQVHLFGDKYKEEPAEYSDYTLTCIVLKYVTDSLLPYITL